MRRKSGVSAGAAGEPQWPEEPVIRLSTADGESGGDWTLAGDQRNTTGAGGEAGIGSRRFTFAGKGIAAGVLTILAVVAGLVGLSRSKTTPPTVPLPAKPAFVLPAPTAPPPPGSELTVLAAGEKGTVLDLALGQSLFVLYTHPSRLVAVGPLVTPTTLAVPVSATAGMVVADNDIGQVWVITAPPVGSSSVQRYSQRTLAKVGPAVRLPAVATKAAAANGTLWLGTIAGVYHLHAGDAGPTFIAGATGSTSSVTIDSARQRVLAAVSTANGEDLLAIDSTAATVIGRGHLGLVDVSLAATAAGVWFAGYGDPGSYGRLGQLRGSTLDAGLDLTSQLGIGPGAAVWPGKSVVWVSSAGADGVTSCIAATNGRVLARWSNLTGRVVSATGVRAAIAMNSIQLLSQTNGCSG